MPPVDLNIPTDIENKSSQEYGDWVGDLKTAGRIDYGDPEAREKNSLMDHVVDNFKNQGDLLRMMSTIEAGKNLTEAQREDLIKGMRRNYYHAERTAQYVETVNKNGLTVAFIAFNKKTFGKMDPEIEKRIKEAKQEQEAKAKMEAEAKKEAAQNIVYFL